MNIVRARSRMLGQDVAFPFPIDTTTGPDYTDPNITYGPGSGATPSDSGYVPFPFPLDTPSASVPKPPSSSLPGFTFPAGTVQQLYPQGLSPAPRIPSSPSSTPFFDRSSLGVRNVVWLALGVGMFFMAGFNKRHR
jgi:hypothetical protein